VFIVVRKPRLDLWPPALRGRLQGRVRLCDFCKWMFPRARPRTARTSRPPESVVGTTALLRARVSSRSGQPPKLRRVRGRAHRVSTLPTGIAHGGDFAPTPIAPGTSCREHRPLPCLEKRGKGAMPPYTARACMARAAGGSCDARLPRRSPTFTNPRGLPSLGRSRREREASLRDSELFRRPRQRLFHRPEPRASGRSHGG
jgi:hypothetical protein